MARLVVAADGRDSQMARMAGRPGARPTAQALLLLLLFQGRPTARSQPGDGLVQRPRHGVHPPQRGGRLDGRGGAGQATAGRVPRRSGASGSRALSEPGGCSEPGRRAPDREMVRKARDAEHGPPCRGAGDGVCRRCRPGVRSDLRRRLRLGVPVGGLAGRGSRPGSARIGSGARSSPGGLRAAPPPRARVPIIGSSPTTRAGGASRRSRSSSTRPRRATPSSPDGSRTSPPARSAASPAPGG